MVRHCAVPPLEGITNKSKLPLRSLAKAICFPSGDQIGVHSYDAWVVSCVAVPPLAGTLDISFVTKRDLCSIRRNLYITHPQRGYSVAGSRKAQGNAG